MVKVGQRIGREQLKVDTCSIDSANSELDIHEGAALVAHPVESVIPHPETRGAVRELGELWTVRTGAAHGVRKHNVRVYIDDLSRIQPAHACPTMRLALSAAGGWKTRRRTPLSFAATPVAHIMLVSPSVSAAPS